MHRSSRVHGRRATATVTALLSIGLIACSGPSAPVERIGLSDTSVAREGAASRGANRTPSPTPSWSAVLRPAPTPTPEPAPQADPAPAQPPAPPAEPPAPCPASTAPTDRASAANTGVPAGTALAPASGGELSQDGLVLENAVISGDVTLTGDNQVLRNVRVEGVIRVTGTGTTITDSELGALTVSGATNFTASRLEVFGESGKDGMHVTSDSGRATNVVIENSWVHSPTGTPSAHYDGIQVRGVDGLVLRGNSFELGPHIPQFNAAVFLENANGGNTDVTITGNYIDGGGFSVYLGGKNTTFEDNSFGRNARWGLLYPESNLGSVTTSGNVWADTGEPAPDFG